MKVERLDGGAFSSVPGIWRQGDDRPEPVRFPVPAYLIEAGSERILVDAGVHPEGAGERYAGAENMRFFQLEGGRVAEQVDFGSLTKVVVTHLHFDHAGGLELLPRDIPIYMQRREWEATHDPEAVARNFFLPLDYAEIGGQLELLDGDHDLLGDGSVELLSTPGHTPGHQSVRVGATLVIGGDVSHYAAGFDDHRFPIFADDHDAQARSAERLRALRDAGATVLPGHDPEVIRPGEVPL